MAEKDDELPVQQQRNKKPARVYYVVQMLIFVALLLGSVVSLGSFGVIQRRLNNFPYTERTQCILFGSEDETLGIMLSSIGSCAFILWGLVSIVIVSFVWIVFSFVQTVLGLRVLSVLRILDFLVMFITCLLSFALSITIAAGLAKTCAAFRIDQPCLTKCLVSPFDPDNQLCYYEGIHIAQSSSWFASIVLLLLTLWSTILTIAYCVRRKNRRREVAMTRLHDEDIDVQVSASNTPVEPPPPEPEDLDDIAEVKRPKNPFSHT